MQNMSSLLRHSAFFLSRRVFSSTPPSQNIHFCPLPDRTPIRIRGSEAPEFLQGLVTNDLDHLVPPEDFDPEYDPPSKKAIYTMLLNTQGRVLFDAILFLGGQGRDEFWLDCHSEAAPKVLKHLKMYKVRRKIDLELMEDCGVVAGMSGIKAEENVASSRGMESKLELGIDAIAAAVDPRSELLGHRILASKESLSQLDLESSPEAYLRARYLLGVSEGPTELPFTKCFPLECNADYLHGVSFQKGCYIGQELTARTHHTGVVRKRVMPLRMREAVDVQYDADVRNAAGKKVGKVRGVLGELMLGVMRIEETMAAKEGELTIDDKVVVTATKPEWWPKEMPKVKKAGREP